MKSWIVGVVAAWLLVASAQAARAQDVDQTETEFATPVVLSAAPVCEGATCASACSTERHAACAGRFPVVRWVREHRPVRRFVRGVARVIVRRGCCR